MKKYSYNTPSCLMLAVDLSMPISLGVFFDERDIVFNSHITLLYSHTFLDKEEVLKEAVRNKILGILRASEPIPVKNLFELGEFDSGFVVLKLKKNSSLFRYLENFNKNLSKKFNVKSDFKDYTPHITLAKTNDPYDKEMLERALDDTDVTFEDLTFSYGEEDVYDLTHNNSVGRYFRIENLKKELKDL